MTSDLSEPEPSIDDLFEAYIDAREEDEEPDVEAWIARAGARAEALRRRIQDYEHIASVADEIARPREADLTQVIGRYHLESQLASGGTAKIYLARDPRVGRQVVIKVFDRVTGLDRDERQWVLNEARALGKLQHPNIVGVLDVGEEKDRVYLVTQHLAGPTLAQVIAALRGEEKGELETEQRAFAERYREWRARLACLTRICDAVSFVHERGVVHRDLKPANIVFDEDGEPRLLDFGISHVGASHEDDEDTNLGLTQTFTGTPAYLAPEQIEDEAIGADPKTDQFSLGVIAYEFLALKQPFQRGQRTRTMQAIALEAPEALRKVAPELPPDLALVVMHALEKDPVERYPSVRTFAADLTALLQDTPISIRAPGLWRTASLFVKRHRRRVLAGASGAFVLVASLIGAWLYLAAQDRGDVESSLRSTRLANLHTARELARAGSRIGQLGSRSRQLDSQLSAAFFPGLVQLAERSLQEWGERVHVAVSEAEVRSAEDGSPFTYTAWKETLFLEQELLAVCTHEDHRRGSFVVQNPGEVRLLKAHPALPGTCLEKTRPFREIDNIATPDPGSYRIQVLAPNGSITRQCDFWFEGGWTPLVRLDIPPPPAEVWERSRPVARGNVTLAEPRDPSAVCEVEVASFRILPTFVTTGEVLEFLELEKRTSRGTRNLDSDHPAVTTAEIAEAYCAALGGRLPSALELLRALQENCIELPSENERILGELIGDVSASQPAEWGCIVRHSLLVDMSMPGQEGAAFNMLNMAPKAERASFDSSAGELSFRVCYSTKD